MALAKPSLGQPLDVSFIGTLVDSINNIDNKITSTNTAATSQVGNSATARLATSLAFAAETVTGVTITANGKVGDMVSTGSWNYRGVAYKDKPIVLGSVSSNAQTEKNRAFTLNFKDITTNSVTFQVMAAAGTESTSFDISVNLFSIGITS
jgi:hypothetical protein